MNRNQSKERSIKTYQINYIHCVVLMAKYIYIYIYGTTDMMD